MFQEDGLIEKRFIDIDLIVPDSNFHNNIGNGISNHQFLHYDLFLEFGNYS